MTTMDIERFDRLEKRIHKFHPGWEQTSAWLDVVRQNECLNWTWHSELVRPAHVPNWVPILFRYGLQPMDWTNSGWRRYREKTWGKKYWSPLPTNDKTDRIIRFQRYYDPDVPSEDESIGLFRTLLASVPSLTIKWAEEYWDYWSARLGGPRITMDFENEYKITHNALKFIMVIHKVKHWQKKLGKMNIGEIEFPQWVVEAEARRDDPRAYKQKMDEYHRAKYFPTPREKFKSFSEYLDKLADGEHPDPPDFLIGM